MVKSLSAILVSIALLIGAGLFEWFYVDKQFSSFEKEVQTLAVKTEAEEANIEDAKAVQSSWEKRKERLYVWIPHNDISRIDEHLAEAVRLIGEKEYSLAAAKLEVVLHMSSCLPDTYRPAIENIL
ncbi:MAG: DUF4363 family protein [Clostridia bacterium]|nr:DUF4363 family protein [Clostridia bacterium]